VGGTGTVTCSIGTVASGAGGSLTVTTKIDLNAVVGSQITAASYDIHGTGIAPLLGGKVFTTVTAAALYADLAITKTDGIGGIAWGQVNTYTIISCGTGCSSASSTFLQGSQVLLTPTPTAGATFTGWTGGGCTGTGSCTITLSANTTVAAAFTLTNGGTCATNSDCGSGFCTDGVCCNTACGGGAANDCQACNLPGTVGTCSPLTANTVCRASTGACDAAEVCNGSAVACPADVTAANGTSCNDGNVCTQTDACQAGACSGNNPVTCTAADQCHVAGVCDPSSGACSSPAAADGTLCDDANSCTPGDTCTAGACAGKSSRATPPRPWPRSALTRSSPPGRSPP
jgi:hypothetical protein